MGHIHKPMQVGAKQYVYCGTPLACSVSEAGQEKGIRMVELKEKGGRAKDHGASACTVATGAGGEGKPDRGIAAGL